MTRHHLGTLAIACCCVIGSSNLVAAQQTAATFSDLHGSLQRGRAVSVTDDGGRRIEGKLTDLSTTSITLRVDGKEQTLPEARVQQIAERHHMTGRYSLIGLAAGVGVGALAGLGAETECFGCFGRGATMAGMGAVFGGIGAGVGAIVGRAVTRERVVYRANPRHAVTVFVAPLASPRGTGVRATFRF